MRQGYQPIIEARWNEKRLINFRIFAQKQIPPLEWGDRVGLGVRWAPKNNILPGKPTARSNFCFLAPTQFSKLLPLFEWVDPLGPGVRWAPQNKVLLCKPTPRSNFCLLVPAKLFKPIHPFGGVDPAGPGLECPSPHKYKFTRQTHPEEQLLFAGPHPILKANTPIRWSGPYGPGVGVSPPQIKFYMANPPRGATFVYWPPPNS